MSGDRRELAFSWAALAIGAGAWFVAHQFGSNLTYTDCRANGGLTSALIGLVALALIALGGFLSWRVRREGTSPESRSFAAMLGVAVSAFFGFAIVLQTIAGFIIPSCYG